jgi:hypothetical protein
MLIENPFSLIVVVRCDVKFRLSLNVLVSFGLAQYEIGSAGKVLCFFSTMALGTW